MGPGVKRRNDLLTDAKEGIQTPALPISHRTATVFTMGYIVHGHDFCVSGAAVVLWETINPGSRQAALFWSTNTVMPITQPMLL